MSLRKVTKEYGWMVLRRLMFPKVPLSSAKVTTAMILMSAHQVGEEVKHQTKIVIRVLLARHHIKDH